MFWVLKQENRGCWDMGSDGNFKRVGDGVGGVDEETNPDLLKNTPSNIQRLADEIEQCEGRQKYLAHTRSPSDGGDIRWYFCKVPLGFNELAASIPRTEVVGKGEYFRFGMRDSLAIEASFLHREEELLSYWWKEYAECSEGPKGRTSSSTKADPPQSSQASELYAVEEERVGVPVKGGLYEVDLVKRHLFPVYWTGENRRVLRGHWFAQCGLDWLPLREDVAEQLEYAYCRQVWHRRRFQPSGLFAARVDLQGSTPGLHALFTGEDDTWEAWLNVDASGFSGIIKFGGNCIQLRRGYAASPSPKPTQDELRQQKEEQMDDYCSQVPVRHLVFMVHGIGQRLEKSNLVDDVADFRHVTSSLAEKNLTSYQLSAQRVLFIPCQWRKGLKLSGESAVEKITLDGVRGLRKTLSATVHDVLYYMSPIYCQDIIDSVSSQLNRLYLKFLNRNPGYDGKVSIYGHSLGSVLSYDILCHQENLSSPFPMDFMYKKDERDGELNNDHKLSSECNPNADGIEALQDAFDDDKLGRQHIPSFLANEYTKDPLQMVDVCSISSSLEERSIEDREGKIAAGRSTTGVYMQGQPCNSGYVFSLGMDPLSGSGINNYETMDGFNDKKDRNVNNNRCSLDPVEAGSGETMGGYGWEETNRHYVLQHHILENVSKDLHSSGTHDKDKLIMDLKSEVDFLKARVAELESEVSRHRTGVCHEVHPGIADKAGSRNIRSERGDSPKGYKPFINYTKLEFKVNTFFAVGSPLGVFLALRNVRIGIGEGREYWGEENIHEEMPACEQIFNIFHPFDPVAYRVEPLVCKEFVSKRPVVVPYHKGGKRLHIALQDFAEDLVARSQLIKNHLNCAKVKVLTICQSGKEGLEEDIEKDTEEVRSYGSYMMERLTGSKDGRIDHVLQDKTFQHPYISAIKSHTNYWRDHDTALFILKQLYQNIPKEPEQPKAYSSRYKDDLGNLEEQLPLTCSDDNLIRSFSKKARKSDKTSW